MFKFNKSSQKKLATCHEDLQLIANEAIKESPYDFGITHGQRTPDEQFELFKKGRIFINGKWEIQNRDEIVTYLDGYTKKSKHNLNPSEAFDIKCYFDRNITWNTTIFIEIALHILDIAERLFKEDKISNRLIWGGHWIHFKDYAHFQI